MVARTSAVSVLVIDCTTTGWLLPTGTPPTRVVTVWRRVLGGIGRKYIRSALVEYRPADGGPVLSGEGDAGGTGAVQGVGDASGTRDRHHRCTLRHHPGNTDRVGRIPRAGRDRTQQRVGRQLEREPAASGRAVGKKGDPIGGAVLHYAPGQRLAEVGIEPILHRGDRRNGLSLPDLVNGNVREPDPADLPYPLQLGQGCHALAEGDGGVGGVELVKPDLVDPQGLERGLAGAPQVRRTPVAVPAPPAPHDSTLGGNQDPGARSVPLPEGPGDEPLVMPGLGRIEAVGIGGVDQSHPRVEGGVDDPDGLGFRGTVGQGEMHPPVADDGNLTGGEGDGTHAVPRCPEAALLPGHTELGEQPVVLSGGNVAGIEQRLERGADLGPAAIDAALPQFLYGTGKALVVDIGLELTAAAGRAQLGQLLGDAGRLDGREVPGLL